MMLGLRLTNIRRTSCVALACLGLAGVGCAGISAREAIFQNAARDTRDRLGARRPPSQPTTAVLVRHGLLDAARNDPGATVSLLESRLIARPEPDGALALAELSERAALARPGDDPSGMVWNRDAATLAAIALADPATTRPELAIDVHNRALARLIRLSQTAIVDGRPDWRDALQERGVIPAAATEFLAPERFTGLRVVADLRTFGMDHTYRNDGLGVPLIAHRIGDRSGAVDPRDKYLPGYLRVAATAMIVPGGGLRDGDWRREPATLVLLDPFADRSFETGERLEVLAGDRTTPLAVQVAESKLPTLELTGLFNSSFLHGDLKPGLSMIRPYQPGKIPVVLVHGLVSSPRAFVQTINELGNDPAIASRYQFWVFLYPTGQSIPASAAELRQSLAKIRDDIDPDHADPALDRMVVVGHSMGGVLAKMMAQDTGMTLWNAAIRLTYDQLQATPKLRAKVTEYLVFRPVPTVSRVVFIATPHRGSPIANALFGRVIAGMIRGPDQQSADSEEIEKFNGRDVLTPELRGRPLNAIGNLRTDSPILRALVRVPIAATVPYHSIIPLIGGRAGLTDGVVAYSSSHLEGAASELIVSGTHSSQQDPDVTRELRRILLEHLATPEVASALPDRSSQ
jgi:pimeloyl-ACP methyl ester carboxylesterase